MMFCLFFNFRERWIFQLVGIAVVVLSALVFLNNGNEIDPSTMFFKICVVVIVMGSLLTIVGFIGCCGALFENQCLLGTVNSQSNVILRAQSFIKYLYYSVVCLLNDRRFSAGRGCSHPG
jgi:hypothetical protein